MNELVQKRFRTIKKTAGLLGSSVDEVLQKTESLLEDNEQSHKQINKLRQDLVAVEFAASLEQVPLVSGVPVLAVVLPNADIDTLRQMTDRFRQRYPSGVVVLGSVNEGRPVLIGGVTDDLVKRGLNAGEIVRTIAQIIGGSGGGRPTLAQAGGKDPSKLPEAIDQVQSLVEAKLKT